MIKNVEQFTSSLPPGQQALMMENDRWMATLRKAWGCAKRAESAVVQVYVSAVTGYPLVMMTLCFILCCSLSVCGVMFSPRPSFADPSMGFEVKGNRMSGTRLVWDNLSSQISKYKSKSKSYFRRDRKGSNRNLRSVEINENITIIEDTTQMIPRYIDSEENPNCESLIGDLAEDYLIRIILKAKSSDHSELISEESITDLCQINNQLMKSLVDDFDIISYRLLKVRENSPIWSIAGAASCYSGLEFCSGLSAKNISNFREYLTDCSQHRKAIINCYDATSSSSIFQCSDVPEKCTEAWLASTLKHVVSFGDPTGEDDGPFTLIALPALTYEAAKYKLKSTNKPLPEIGEYLGFAEKVESIIAKSKSFDFKGIKVGSQWNFFHEPIRHDNRLCLIALILVWLLILLYSGSLFFSVMVCLTLVFSGGVAYAIYHLAFRIPFFPFLNLMIVVLLLGIGADDAIILSHSWNVASDKLGATSHVTKIAHEAFRHSLLAMFVTSVTTSAAFYSNTLSDVTAIKCFGLFAGTVVLVNFALVLLWLAPSMVIQRIYIQKLWNRLCPLKVHGCTNFIAETSEKITSAIFHRALPALVQALAPFIAIGCSLVMIFSFIAVFHWPGVAFPKSDTFNFFKSSHPFAWYDDNVQQLFSFPKQFTNLRLILLWGFEPVKDAWVFDPKDDGTVSQLTNFSIDQARFQKINSFLKVIQDTSGDYLVIPSDRKTWIDRFLSWAANEPCSKTQRRQCCNLSVKLFDEPNFSKCMLRSTKVDRYGTLQGPIFNRTGSIAGFTWHANTKYDFTIRYLNLTEVVGKISHTIQLAADQTGLQAPMWILAPTQSMLWYNLQSSVIYSLPRSFAISLGVVVLTLIVSTWSLRLSLLTAIPIVAIISITLGTLNLLRWELNIVEAVIVILAAGLSFDYTLHMAVAYKLAPVKLVNCRERVTYAMSYISLPICMAALTTGLAGSCLLGATTKPYFQVGLFIVILTIVALVMALLFFPSLIVTVDMIVMCCSRGFGKTRTDCAQEVDDDQKAVGGNQVNYSTRHI